MIERKLRVGLCMTRTMDLDAYGCLIELVSHAQIVRRTTSTESLVSRMVACGAELLIVDADLLSKTNSQRFVEQVGQHKLQAVVLVDDTEGETQPSDLPTTIPVIQQTADLVQMLGNGDAVPADTGDDLPTSIPPSLTRRERQVWQLIAVGQSVAEAAVTLGLAESTVDSHKSNLMKKLKARKAVDLVRLAIRLGIVDL